jgi:hypothetical protein
MPFISKNSQYFSLLMFVRKTLHQVKDAEQADGPGMEWADASLDESFEREAHTQEDKTPPRILRIGKGASV